MVLLKNITPFLNVQLLSLVSCYKSFCLLVIVIDGFVRLDYTTVYDHWMLETDIEWGPGPTMVSLAHWAQGYVWAQEAKMIL